MRTTAANLLNCEALLVLKGKQTVHRWIADVQEDRIVTYPVNAPHPSSSRDPVGREIFRYAGLLDIQAVAGAVPARS